MNALWAILCPGLTNATRASEPDEDDSRSTVTWYGSLPSTALPPGPVCYREPPAAQSPEPFCEMTGPMPEAAKGYADDEHEKALNKILKDIANAG